MWNPFKKKKSTIQLLDEYGWISVENCLFERYQFKLDISDEHGQWNILDTNSGAMLSGNLDKLEDSLNFVEKYKCVQ